MTKTKHKATPKVLLGIVAVLILFILTLAVYQVDSTEYVIVTQFGNPVRVVENPGLIQFSLFSDWINVFKCTKLHLLNC